MNDGYLNCDRLGNYEPIGFPFQSGCRELTDEQAKITFERFEGSLPEMLRILFNAIWSDDPAVAEKLDYSPESLIPLGEWFSKHVHTRKRSKQEVGRNFFSL